MENRYKINYDLKQNYINSIKFKQGDIDSSVLELTLYDNGVPVDITGESIEFRFLKPDKNLVFQDGTTGVKIIDAMGGIVECILKSNTLSVPGVVKCEVHRSKDGKELTTPSFYFTVDESIGQGELSTTYISKIETKVLEWQNNFEASQTAMQSTFNTNETNRQKTFDANETVRKTDFEQIKTDYNTYKNVMIAESNVAELQSQINENKSQLADMTQQLPENKKYLLIVNEDGTNKNLIEVLNYDRTNKQTAIVVHNYTDGQCGQFDNVGSGTILKLVNAHNPERRTDKDSSYVGDGAFLTCSKYMDGVNQALLSIYNTGDIVWSGIEDRQGRFVNYKAVSTKYQFEFSGINAQTNLIRISNGTQYVLSILNDQPVDSINTRAVIQSSANQTNGIYINALSGPIRFKSANGNTYLDDTVWMEKPIRMGVSSEANAPIRSIFVDDTSGQLKFKNASGVVTALA